MKDSCKIENCHNPIKTRGWCNKHYQVVWKGKDPTKNHCRTPRHAVIEGSIAKIPLGIDAKDGYSLVDIDLAWIDKYQWYKAKTGYAVAWVGGEKLYMHRLIMDKPNGKMIDHINHDTLDNRISNLRLATHSQNQRNRKLSKRNTSGVHGVSWAKNERSWTVRIRVGKRYLNLGYFEDINEAKKVRQEAEIKYYGVFAPQGDI